MYHISYHIILYYIILYYIILYYIISYCIILYHISYHIILYYIILYYILMGLPSYTRICGPSLTETSLCGAHLYLFPDITTPSITNIEVATNWPRAGTWSSGQRSTSLRHWYLWSDITSAVLHYKNWNPPFLRKTKVIIQCACLGSTSLPTRVAAITIHLNCIVLCRGLTL